MESFVSWIAGACLVSVVILLHEAGHLTAGKLCRIRISEFHVGIGPTLLRWTRGDTTYFLHVIPLLGAVKYEPLPGGRFTDYPLWARTVFIAAGPMANILTAVLLSIPLVWVMAAEHGAHVPLWALPWVAIKLTFYAIGSLLGMTASAAAQGTIPVVGPAKLLSTASEAILGGYELTLLWTWLLSISVGLFNLVPWPPLDGSHLLLYVVEAIRGRPLSDQAERQTFRYGTLALLALVMVVTIRDILHP